MRLEKGGCSEAGVFDLDIMVNEVFCEKEITVLLVDCRSKQTSKTTNSAMLYESPLVVHALLK